MAPPPIRLRLLGTVPYLDALTLMRSWTAARHAARKGASVALQGLSLQGDPVQAPPVQTPPVQASADSARASSPATISRRWPMLDEAASAGDEIWLMQHPPVFTLGMNSQPEHLLAPGDIPVVPTERGGQVTYHGPGQLMAYLMLELRPRKLGIRRLVEAIEEALIDCLGHYGIRALRQEGAPGIYVHPRVPARPVRPVHDTPAPAPSPKGTRVAHRPAADVAKIASIGIKTSNGFSYHGLALNAQMDLSPFARINPCGFSQLQMTDIQREQAAQGDVDLDELAWRLGHALRATLER